MRKAAILLAAAAGAAALAAVLLGGPSPQAGNASSHREAPLISEDPTADNTDLYAYRSNDAPGMLTIISNWIPAEDPAAGPNYYRFSEGARYDIYVDQNGDGRPDVTYYFRFKSNPGPLFLGDTVQSYTVTRIVGHGRPQVIARATTPPDNIGPRTLKQFYGTTDYRAIAASHVHSLADGGQVFAGQRDDAFFADVGDIFDLVAIRKGIGNAGGGKDFLAGYAVHAIALQVPISQIDTSSHVVGVWAATDRRSVVVGRRHRAVSGWVQVSRLGNPLVNEVVIPTKYKDLWNRLTPASDKRFLTYFENPMLAAVMNQLYMIGAPEHNWPGTRTAAGWETTWSTSQNVRSPARSRATTSRSETAWTQTTRQASRSSPTRRIPRAEPTTPRASRSPSDDSTQSSDRSDGGGARRHRRPPRRGAP